jgi:DNA-binding XRE family transcriptional regulator
MSPEHIGNYLRSHRRTCGLSQHELAHIVGYLTRFQVARHEDSAAIPALMVAISYEIVFRVPINEMFPGLYRSVEARIEEQLGMLEQKLQESTAKGREAAFIARKLEWLWTRRNPETV